MESIMIRSSSSGGFITERDACDEPSAMGRLLLGALAQIILKWPRSVQRGGDQAGRANIKAYAPIDTWLARPDQQSDCPAVMFLPSM
jgi:hypothetical protein